MMVDAARLAGDLLDLFRRTLRGVYDRFTAEDRAALERYAARMAEQAARAQAAATPDERARAEENLRSYQNAISAMVARYEILMATELEKALLEGLTIVGQGAVRIILSSL